MKDLYKTASQFLRDAEDEGFKLNPTLIRHLISNDEIEAFGVYTDKRIGIPYEFERKETETGRNIITIRCSNCLGIGGGNMFDGDDEEEGEKVIPRSPNVANVGAIPPQAAMYFAPLGMQLMSQMTEAFFRVMDRLMKQQQITSPQITPAQTDGGYKKGFDDGLSIIRALQDLTQAEPEERAEDWKTAVLPTIIEQLSPVLQPVIQQLIEQYIGKYASKIPSKTRTAGSYPGVSSVQGVSGAHDDPDNEVVPDEN